MQGKKSLRKAGRDRNIDKTTLQRFIKKKRKGNTNQRKCVKTAILTDTPEKQAIEKAYEERQKKLAGKKLNSKEKGKLKKKAPKRKIIDSSSEESDVPVPLDDESPEDERSDPGNTDLNVGDFVLVNFATKHRSLRYVGMVEKVEDDEILTQFLRRIQGNKKVGETHEPHGESNSSPFPVPSGLECRVGLVIEYEADVLIQVGLACVLSPRLF
ncbi:hypothetical protein F7725_007523 [Dissostichus mawsoni]|uniref:Uncharacterized protein n=1 Tax=Dissostichus mawsoni TaxID=36200 RepID=A0A7J5Y4Q7_DISMA|nr:hypothetical protein F7725_007523 [Dissostichus mawsoni]